MYSFGQIRRGLRRGVEDPSVFLRECNRLYHRRLYRDAYNTGGVDVMAADWDTLVILDACRYDVFRDESTLPGRLEARQSRGSHTVEFLEGNFADRTLDDTVYITASPQLSRWQDRIDTRFHDTLHVWRTDGWDDEYNTVLPETVTDRAVQALQRYPNKRHIVHYLQPHYPFIGAPPELNVRGLGEGTGGPDIWGRLRRGDDGISPTAVREAYRENLRRALPAVRDLLTAIDGRTVVTADHGNMFGERAQPLPYREWGHPPGLHTEQLVTVPWLVDDSGPRREITAGEATSAATTDDSELVSDRLKHLGYVE